jgi:hypothetical protein
LSSISVPAVFGPRAPLRGMLIMLKSRFGETERVTVALVGLRALVAAIASLSFGVGLTAFQYGDRCVLAGAVVVSLCAGVHACVIDRVLRRW